MRLWEKIIRGIIISVFIASVSAIAITIVEEATRYSPLRNFYPAVTVLFFAALISLSIMCVCKIATKKIRCILFVIVFAAVGLTIVCAEINMAYHNSIETVGDSVDLTLYEPFAEGTKAASLGEPSELKLNENLPRLDGATALYPLYSAFACAVYPEGDYPVYYTSYTNRSGKYNNIVVCNTTSRAYERLINGEADIIFVTGPSKEQIELAEKAGVELELTPIGREAFVFFVNAKNPVSSLTTEDVRRIYSGKVTNWKEFGGKNKKIRPYQRSLNSGSQTKLVEFMGDIQLMNPPSEDVIIEMNGIIFEVSSYKNYDNAIGYSFLFYATEMVNDNKIKLLALDGVEPTRGNVANGSYPSSTDFYAVTAGTENPNAEKFIEWILSPQGRYLIEKTGYTPIGR